MYRYLFFLITFLILKKEISLVSAIESIIFTTLVFLINKLCVYKITSYSSNKISIINTLQFIVIIIKDIIISSWNISKIILLNQNLVKISPTIKRVDTRGLTRTKTVVFASSITLTPGTISFNIEKEAIYVHALKKQYLIDIQNSKLINFIEKI